VPYVSIVAETQEGPRVIARTELTAADMQIGRAIRLHTDVIDPEFSYVWAEAAP
jgi:hypothetical protein